MVSVDGDTSTNDTVVVLANGMAGNPEITADGKISGDEIDDFIYIQDELERISITVETLQLWAEKMLANGVIDADAYNARKNK